MRIKQIELKDFRCFENFQMTFSENFNTHVIIAENMVGKSAVMAALRLTANTYTSGLKSEKQLQLNDHRIIGSNPISDVSPDVSIISTALIKQDLKQESLSIWKKYKGKPKGERTKIEILKGKDPRQISKILNKLTAEKKAIQPLLSFIGTEYIHAESSDTVDWEINGRSIDGYKGCFEDKSIKKYLFKWLGRMDGIISEMSRKPLLEEYYKELPNHAMTVFQDAVKSILPDISEIVWSHDLKEPIVKLSNNEIRPFNVLSDGYRYLILLAGELATRAFILNKHLGTDVLKEVHGLVLIDEFGIHLHPALQNDSLISLQNTFPKVQFIVSTHSPMMLNGLKKEQVHILSIDNEGNRICSNPDEDILGLGANEILTQVFGLRTTMDDEFVKMNEEYTILFYKKKSNSLGKDEESRFMELTRILSTLRLDPQLKLVQEDPLTALVKERLTEKTKKSSKSGLKTAPESIEQQVDDILGDIFKETSS